MTLSNINVVDSVFGTITNLSPTTLVPGAQATGTVTYPTTQGDYDHGSVNNTATVYNGSTPLNQTNATITATGQNKALTITKKPNTPTYTEGQSVTYTYTVTNSGNVTLSNINVVDSVFGTITNLSPTTLVPGAQATGTVTYPTTQGDYDHGSVNNTATVYNGSTPLNQTNATITATGQNKALTITKKPNTPTYTEGQSVTYTYTVTNSGNVTLSNINVVDSVFGTITNLSPTTLVPGAQATGTVTYPTTQGDYDHGSVNNTATVYNGSTPLNQTNATITAIGQNKALTLTKKPNPPTYNEGQSVPTLTL